MFVFCDFAGFRGRKMNTFKWWNWVTGGVADREMAETVGIRVEGIYAGCDEGLKCLWG